MPTKKKSAAAKKSNQANTDLIASVVIALLLGFGGGYIVADSLADNDTDHDTHSMSEESSHGHSHSHDKYEVEAASAPTVQLMVTEDKKSGYNIMIRTENFTFTPENVNGENVAGEGHAHIYVGNEKIARVYSNNFHYDGSFEGTKEFRVTLNANDHSEYALNGEVIETSVLVTHDSSDPNHNAMHKHDDDDHMHSN